MQDTGNIFLDTVDRFRTAENIFQDTVYWFRIAAAQDTARGYCTGYCMGYCTGYCTGYWNKEKWKYYCKMKTKYICLIILQKSTQKWLTIYNIYFFSPNFYLSKTYMRTQIISCSTFAENEYFLQKTSTTPWGKN